MDRGRVLCEVRRKVFKWNGMEANLQWVDMINNNTSPTHYRTPQCVEDNEQDKTQSLTGTVCNITVSGFKHILFGYLTTMF